MSSTKFLRYRLRLQPLSPLHIGSGLAVEPFEYQLLKDEHGCWLILYDLPKLLASLSDSDRAEFNRQLDRNDFAMIRRWLREHAGNECRRFVTQIQEGAYEELVGNRDNPDRLGEIELFTRNAATGQPYLPGSSIKGAIRTAILDARLTAGDLSASTRRDLDQITQEKDRRGNLRPNAAQRFEAAALGYAHPGGRPNLYRDPFRQLALTDATLPADACYVDRVRIVRPVDSRRGRGGGEVEGIQMYREMTWSLLDGESVEYTGEVRLYPALTDPARMRPDRRGQDTVLPQRWSIEQICEACREYYVPKIESQLDTFTPRGSPSDEDIRAPLLQASEGLLENECIVRLGRHSHWECTVLSRPYNVPPRRGYGKSRTYANGELPLGWTKLIFEPLK